MSQNKRKNLWTGNWSQYIYLIQSGMYAGLHDLPIPASLLRWIDELRDELRRRPFRWWPLVPNCGGRLELEGRLDKWQTRRLYPRRVNADASATLNPDWKIPHYSASGAFSSHSSSPQQPVQLRLEWDRGTGFEGNKVIVYETLHTLAIWTFTFHKISRFVSVILKANFKPTYRPNLSIFLSENSHLLNSFFFYFLQNLSNPLLFTHCCCYSKELTCWNCDFCIKLQFKHVNCLK